MSSNNRPGRLSALRERRSRQVSKSLPSRRFKNRKFRRFPGQKRVFCWYFGAPKRRFSGLAGIFVFSAWYFRYFGIRDIWNVCSNPTYSDQKSNKNCFLQTKMSWFLDEILRPKPSLQDSNNTSFVGKAETLPCWVGTAPNPAVLKSSRSKF